MSDFDIVLPSGRVIEANGGIIGIDANAKISAGYDFCITVLDNTAPERKYFPEDTKNVWTPQERRELAMIAIERWVRFAAGK